MGIFKKNQPKPPADTTDGFSFGKAEAEGEVITFDSKADYFEDFLLVVPQVALGKFILSGRKGVGKSAVARHIDSITRDDETSFTKIIKYNEIELERLIQSDVDRADNIEFALFEWVILTQMLRLVVDSERYIYYAHYKPIKRFLRDNSGHIEIDKQQVIQTKTGENKGIRIGAFKAHASFRKELGEIKERPPFYKLVLPLRHIIQDLVNTQISSGLEFILILDDLDIRVVRP